MLPPLPLHGASFLPGAHHPHCERHRHHLLWVGSRPLCLGCTCLYSGAVVGFGLGLLSRRTPLSFVPWLALHLVLTGPTAIQPFFQRKWFKIGSRAALGIASGSYFITGLVSVVPPVSRPVFFASLPLVFLLVFWALTRLRRRFAHNPCVSCPLGAFPTCDWNLPRLLAANPDSDLLRAINRERSEKRTTLPR